MTTGHTLLAVIPPGSIEREVSALQNAMFADRGCISAVALSPLIPVAFVADGRMLSAARLGTRADRGVTFRTVGWTREKGWLYLDVESGGAWETLRDSVSGESRQAALFPVRQGFFMGCGEEGGGGVEAGLKIPALSFSSCSLVLLKLHAASDGGWWREVSTEVLEKVPLR
jgi:hypothetical protein